MTVWKLGSVLALLLLVFFSNGETVLKTVTKKPDVTQICSKAALNVIMMIVCKISTERSNGEECRLLYHYDEGFIHGCDSRFTLMKENQTVFLHLTNLTPEDSGNYTCECVFHGGIDILHLSVAVEAEDGTLSRIGFVATVIIISAAATLISVAGIACGHILKRTPHREKGSGPSNLIRSETLQMSDKEDPYTSLQQQTRDVYQTVSSARLHHDPEAGQCHSHVR